MVLSDQVTMNGPPRGHRRAPARKDPLEDYYARLKGKCKDRLAGNHALSSTHVPRLYMLSVSMKSFHWKSP
jgi:hypothetical protein